MCRCNNSLTYNEAILSLKKRILKTGVQALCNMGILAIPLMLQSQSYLKLPLTPLEVTTSSNYETVSWVQKSFLKLPVKSSFFPFDD